MLRNLLLLQSVFYLAVITIQGQVIDDSIPAGRNFNKAIFRLWMPPDIKALQGTIILMPGSNGDGRELIDEKLWQKLARKYGFALLGCYFTDHDHENMMIENYVNAKEGSGQALIDVLIKLSEKTNHNELATAPLLLWGHSAGGEFNYEFLCWKPGRVLAFVVNKGGFYYSALAPMEARNVPGLFFTGEKDLEARSNIVKGIFSMNRRAGALWAFAEEPGAGHEPGQTLKLACVFFDEVIPLRLNKLLQNTATDGYMRTIAADSGCLGDYYEKKVVSSAESRIKNYPCSWLPSLKFAEAWQLFLKKIPF